jgi:ABC-type uncharacterized transport system substrate-binding protein
MVLTARARKIFSPGPLLLLSCLASLLAQHNVQGAPAPPAKKVLLVYAYQSMLPAIFEWDAGIRAALKGSKAQPVEFYTEFLDLLNFVDESYVQSLVNLLRVKYRNQKIDLLIPVGSSAFSFLKAHGNALFPGTPIVFCYVPKLQVEAQKLPPNSTGVMGWVDVQGTLAAALTLRPGTRRVVLVGGAGKVERHYQNIAREALRPYEGRFEITFLTDLPLPEILKQLENLPPQTLVLYLSVFSDSTGQAFVPREVAGRVAQAANAPVFGLWENLLGQGIVGGHLTSFTEQGRLAGEMGRRVLNGEKPENIPAVWQEANFYAFDWRQLERWGLKEGALPPGSLVRFKEPSLWEKHKTEIMVAATLFSLLSLLAVGLLIDLCGAAGWSGPWPGAWSLRNYWPSCQPNLSQWSPMRWTGQSSRGLNGWVSSWVPTGPACGDLPLTGMILCPPTYGPSPGSNPCPQRRCWSASPG